MGKQANIWLSDKSVKIWEQIENKSAFVNLALEDAVGIMTWAILKKQDPKKYHVTEDPFEEVVGEFNEAFPVDPLTAKRQNKQWPKNSPKKPELW